MKPTNDLGPELQVNVIYKGENCQDLPVYKDGPIIISAWELEPGELERIQQTGKIFLGLYGGSQPPVILATAAEDIPRGL